LATFEIRCVRAELFDAAALRVDDQLLEARGPVQLRLIPALDTGLAYERRARVLVHVDVFLIFLADRADVADGVHRALGERLVASETRADFDAREVLLADGEPRELVFAQLQLDRHGVEAAPRHDFALDRRDTLAIDEGEIGEPLQRLVDVR